MRDLLVPAVLVEDCLDVHLSRHTPTGQALYLTTLALTIGAAAAMPMIQVPVTVQANGVLRPSIERQEARAAESGIVLAVYAREGQRVRAGDTVLVLDGSTIVTRLASSDSIAHARRDELDDLARMLAARDSVVARSTIKTSHRRQQFREHAMIVGGLVSHANAEWREVERLRALLARGFVTAEQVDRQEESHRAAIATVREHVERMRSAWSDEHARLADELRRVITERAELTAALARHVVIAPVDGTVELTTSLSPGSVLQRGERVATLSPNTGLIGEVLLSARDIALVRHGTPVRLMIDALNYREWGSVEATVAAVADDAVLTGEQPVFRVRCHLATRELRLRGGQRASLGKGMTFRARFVIAKRSLWQLLFDEVDAWLNPARTPHLASATR